MKVGIYTNIYKDKNLAVTKQLLRSFTENGISCYTHANLTGKVLCDGHFSETSEISDLDMVLTIGGDGTMLSIAKWGAEKRIPILGVNLGKLGFLTEAEPRDFDLLAKEIAVGNYLVERRSMLCAKLGNSRFNALNEIVITRRNVSKMIMLQVDIQGAPVDKYYCDGFLVCTPTGSTAYSLSAGGPIISPTANVFSMTPINSHSIHSRPIVIGDNEKIGVTLTARADDALVIADGKNVCTLPEKRRIQICKSSRDALFVRLNKNEFYERLFRKLNTWSTTPSEEG